MSISACRAAGTAAGRLPCPSMRSGTHLNFFKCTLWPPAMSAVVCCVSAAHQTTKQRMARAVALAFEAQLVDRVPVEPHDRGVDIVVTAGGMLSCSPRAQQLLGADTTHVPAHYTRACTSAERRSASASHIPGRNSIRYACL